MDAAPIAGRAVLQGGRSLVGFFKSIVDPLVVIAVLCASTWAYDERVRAGEVLLAAWPSR